MVHSRIHVATKTTKMQVIYIHGFSGVKNELFLVAGIPKLHKV